MLQLTNELDLTRSIALSNLSICYTWKNIKSSNNNNKFKISTPTSGMIDLTNDKFDK